jgi:uncharacterized delta-60 repeat protein
VGLTAIDAAGNRYDEQVVITVDREAPTVQVSSLQPVAGASFQHVDGSSLYYNPAGTGTFRADARSTDDIGVSTATFPDLDGPGASGWSDGATVSAIDGEASHEYTWTVGATVAGNPQIVVTDLAGRTSSTPLSVVTDSLAPTGGTITYADSATRASSVDVQWTIGTDAGSGVNAASARVERSTASLSNGQCGTFTAFVATTVVAPPAPYVDTNLVADGCYRYRLGFSDNVGNRQIVSSSSTVRIDRTAPTGSIAVAGSPVTVSGTASDAGVGLSSISVAYSGPASGLICQPAPSASWNCQWDTSGLAEGTYTVTATLTDLLGNQSTKSTSFVKSPPPREGAGFLDQTFGTGGIVTTNISPNGGNAGDNLVSHDGDIITVGTRLGTNGDNSIAVTSHKPNGAIDTAFGTNGIAIQTQTRQVNGEAGVIDRQGRIVVAGSAHTSSFSPRLGVTRFNTNGTVDSTFGTNGTAMVIVPGPDQFNVGAIAVAEVIVDSSDRILVGGMRQIGGVSAFTVMRFTPAGVLDTTFGNGGTALFTWPDAFQQEGGYLTETTGGRYLVGGNAYITTFNPQGRHVLVLRTTPNGALDTTYGSNGYYVGRPENLTGSVRKLIAETDGGVTIGLYCDGGCGLGIARLTTDGALDTAFGSANDGATYVNVPNESARDFDLVRTSEGQFVAVGQAGSNNAPDRIAIGRFHANGSLDTGYGNNGTNVTTYPAGAIRTVSAIQLPTGDIVVAGTLIPTSGLRQYLLAAYGN